MTLNKDTIGVNIPDNIVTLQAKVTIPNQVKYNISQQVIDIIDKEILKFNIYFEQILEDFINDFTLSLDENIEKDESVIDNDKIIHKYRISKIGESKIKAVLQYYQTIALLEKKINNTYNFDSLRKKIHYYNNNTNNNIVLQNLYIQEELENIRNQITGENSDIVEGLIEQITKDISGIEKQNIYKQKLRDILYVYEGIQGIPQLSLNKIYNNLSLKSIFLQINIESQKNIQQSFESIKYQYKENNQDFIDIQEKKERIKLEKAQEKEILKGEKNSEKNDSNKKELSNKLLLSIVMGSLFSIGVLIKNINDSQDEILNNSNIRVTQGILQSNNLINTDFLMNSDIKKIDKLVKFFMKTAGTSIHNIDELKSILAVSMNMFENNGELTGNNYNYTIGNIGENILEITIVRDGKTIIKSKKFERIGLLQEGTIDLKLQNNFKLEVSKVIGDFMNHSPTIEKLIDILGKELIYSVTKIFNKGSEKFIISISQFLNNIYIKVIDRDTNQEYNINFLLDKHLQE